MTLEQLVKKSYYGVVTYVGELTDISYIEQYLNLNRAVIERSLGLILAVNYRDNSMAERVETAVKQQFNKVEFIHLKHNRGHSIGACDLDGALVDYCKENNRQWLIKTSLDNVIQHMTMYQSIPEADFYYLNSFSYETIALNDFDFDKLKTNRFSPQTNFYIIDVTKVDYLYDKEYLDWSYNFIQTTPNFNGKIWTYVKGWSNEDYLGDTIIRNNMSKHHLIKDETYYRLFKIVEQVKMGDPSHKNLMIDGICHLHYPEQNVYTI